MINLKLILYDRQNIYAYTLKGHWFYKRVQQCFEIGNISLLDHLFIIYIVCAHFIKIHLEDEWWICAVSLYCADVQIPNRSTKKHLWSLCWGSTWCFLLLVLRRLWTEVICHDELKKWQHIAGLLYSDWFWHLSLLWQMMTLRLDISVQNNSRLQCLSTAATLKSLQYVPNLIIMANDTVIERERLNA